MRAGLSGAGERRHHPGVTTDTQAAPAAAEMADRIENPQDVDFAIHALLGTEDPDPSRRTEARAAILSRLPPAPTLGELVEAVYAWLGPQAPPPEDSSRRRARWMLAAYFLLDPPVRGELHAAEPT